MNEIIYIHSIELCKFLVDNGIKVYNHTKMYQVIKDAFGRYIDYCKKTEFSGGNIELYSFEGDYFFIISSEFNRSDFATNYIIGLFDKEMYTQENLNQFDNTFLFNKLLTDVEFCANYDNLISFLIDYSEKPNDFENYLFKAFDKNLYQL